ncbi:MAG TPA: VIT domain-containing protein [Kofleriaceae bacterium]|jgi:tetratricopeptide (TPR) repeat protein
MTHVPPASLPPGPDDSDDEILERNVSSLLENGGERPRISAAARTRIREALVAEHAKPAADIAPSRAQPRARSRFRSPLVAAGGGFAALAATAVLAVHFVGGGPAGVVATGDTKLAPAPGSLPGVATWIADTGANVAVLGPRKLRVEGNVLIDVVPGKGPFVVETAHGTIQVTGTRFVVEATEQRTSAAVVRGVVQLASAGASVTLHAGEQGVAEAGRPPTRGPAPRLSHLVSWAAEQRRAEEPIAAPHHGTLFARDPGVRSHPPWGQDYPLPLSKLNVDLVVEDQVVRVALDQTFLNEQPQDLEGVYRFAIPPDAALQRLAMYNHGKLEESAVVERMEARRIYEDLVYHRVDPGLLEWAGSGRVSLRVYPIESLQDKRIVLAYTQSLPKLYDDYTVTVPLPEIETRVGDLSFSVKLAGCANCEISVPGYPVETERKGDDSLVHFAARNAPLGDSLVLHVRDPRRRELVAQHTDGADKYLLVRAPIALRDAAAPAPAHKPRTWVILDDVSASREPAERRAQTDLVDAFVREVDEQDRIAVLAFDVTARPILPLTRALDVDRKALRTKLGAEGGVGATDFAAALQSAVALLGDTPPDDAMIVYLGDGVVTSGTRHLDELRAQLVGRAHFVGVGVGDGPDTQTLEGLAGPTGGYATTIDLGDDLGWRAFDLVAALHTARVTNLAARLLDSSGSTVPATAYLHSPQLADGEELELVAKLAGPGTPFAIELTGTLDGAPWAKRIPLVPPSPIGGAAPIATDPTMAGIPITSGAGDSGYLPRLWAQRHIAARLAAKHEPVVVPPCPIRSLPAAGSCRSEADVREARDEGIRREVVALGKKYFLLSRHTSLLVLEDDAMYARFGVTKGAGETWAAYPLPKSITMRLSGGPSTLMPSTGLPPGAALDSELVRPAFEPFAALPTGTWFGTRASGIDDHVASDLAMGQPNIGDGVTGGVLGTGAAMPFGVGQGRGGGGAPEEKSAKAAAEPAVASGKAAVDGPVDRDDPEQGKGDEASLTGGDNAAVVVTATATPAPSAVAAGSGSSVELPAPSHHAAVDKPDRSDPYAAGPAPAGDTAVPDTKPTEAADESRRDTTTHIVSGHGAGTGSGYGIGSGRIGTLGRGMRFGGEISTKSVGYTGFGMPQLVRMTNPSDPAFDDLTALVPGLAGDAADDWRTQLRAAGGDEPLHTTTGLPAAKSGPPYAIDPAAQQLLADARRALPAGVYHWDDVEIAVDSARRFGWRRTTDTDLLETASYDNHTFLRRYDELGLDVSRIVTADDVALQLAYLPMWIAEPSHYARWFRVTAKGQTVILSRGTDPTKIALQLGFDSAHHLVSISDGEGRELVRITWGGAGPSGALVLGHPVTIGFSAEAVADAPAWAHSTAPGATGSANAVVVEPLRTPQLEWFSMTHAGGFGHLDWHQSADAYMAALAATGNYSQHPAGAPALGELVQQFASHGGAKLGDIVLASGGLSSLTDAQLSSLLAPFTATPVGKYLLASRASTRTLALAAPDVTSGHVGALWQLRSIESLAQRRSAAAVDELVAMGVRAPALRLIGATVIGYYTSNNADILRAWDSLASGSLRNVARGYAIEALWSHGQYDAAADRLAALVADLDLTAPPPRIAVAPYIFGASRRGSAGWELTWATWRERVLAGASYEHALALLPMAASHPADIPMIANRAVALADGDADRIIAVGTEVATLGQSGLAKAILSPQLARRPSHDLYALVGRLALQSGNTQEAFDDLTAAQDAGTDEPAPLASVRGEYAAILETAKQLVAQTYGAPRDAVLTKALAFGQRWRDLDPSGGADVALGDLFTAAGDRTEAWRQLSTVIERDPMSGAGYATVADSLERQGRVSDALDFWQQSIVIDQTNPTPRLRKAQALIALGRTAEGDALLDEIASRHWHDMWSSVVYQAADLRSHGRRSPTW